MKPILKFITIPLPFFSSPDLSVNAKWVAIAIDAYVDSPDGVAMGVKAIQTATNLSAKEVKTALLELKEKGAIEVNIGDNGEKLIKPFLYKDRYVSSGTKFTEGDKPSNIGVGQIDFDEIAQKWREILPDMPQISRWTPVRKRKLKSVLKQADINVTDLYKCFKIISVTPFLRGMNDRQWMATFNWLINNSNNVLKVLEGTYSKKISEKHDYENIIKDQPVHQKKGSDDIYR